MIPFLLMCVLVLFHLNAANSHGILLNPIGRGSRWRFNSTAPKDYNDNQGFCGGFNTQFQVFGGKCGLCGDSYGLPRPRPHEFGGIYGEKVIVQKYESGSVIPVDILITANHNGYFMFHLCNMDQSDESEDCFYKNPLKLSYDDSYKYYLDSVNSGWYNTTLQLPFINCDHCILRWTYTAGNSWGICEDQTEAIGCDRQENFKACADISIQSQQKFNSFDKHLKKKIEINLRKL